MSAPHTPGPWRVQAGMVVAPGSRRAVAVTEGGGAVRFAEEAAERRANAQLIAAAPDLLAAMRTIREFVHDDAGFPNPVDRLNNILGITHLAIAKAEGR